MLAMSAKMRIIWSCTERKPAAIADANNDGIPDLILGGNTFGLNTQLGRMDGLKLTGLISKPGEKITFEKADNLPLISGEIRDLKKIKVGGNEYLLVSRNNETLKSYRLK